jgi:hypothetical protein
VHGFGLRNGVCVIGRMDDLGGSNELAVFAINKEAITVHVSEPELRSHRRPILGGSPADRNIDARRSDRGVPTPRHEGGLRALTCIDFDLKIKAAG